MIVVVSFREYTDLLESAARADAQWPSFRNVEYLRARTLAIFDEGAVLDMPATGKEPC
jgi:hypothetical protein